MFISESFMPYSGKSKGFGSTFKEPDFLKQFKWPREKCAQNSLDETKKFFVSFENRLTYLNFDKTNQNWKITTKITQILKV